MFLKIIMLHISKSYLWCLKDQRDPTSPFWRRSALGFLWREWCWSWNSSTLSTSCEELTHWKRLWCWERSGAGGEGDDRGWDGWMASLTSWTWFWVNSGSFCDGQGGLACCDSWGRRVEHDWGTELNWTERSKGMAIHSNILAWRNSWTEDPSGYSLQGRSELDTTEQLTLKIELVRNYTR